MELIFLSKKEKKNNEKKIPSDAMKIFSKNPTSPFTAGHVIIVITLKCHPYENGMAEYRMRKLKRAMFRILHRVLIGVNM